MLNLPGEWGWEKEMYSQCQTIIEQAQEKQEKLIAGIGQQANLTRQGTW
jgi:exonuclease VII small subunit